MTDEPGGTVPSEETAEAASAPATACSGRYSLAAQGGALSEEGDAGFALYADRLCVSPASGAALTLPLRDIVSFSAAEHSVRCEMVSGDVLTLGMLGFSYDGFVAELTSLRNETLLKDMLMREELRLGGIRGRLALATQGGERQLEAGGEARVYDTALVLLPDGGDPRRVPLGQVRSITSGSEIITVEAEASTVMISMLGYHHDAVLGALREAVAALTAQAQEQLLRLLPGADPMRIRAASTLLRDGRAAGRDELETAAPGVWAELEQALKTRDPFGAYAVLAGLGVPGQTRIGFKRGLMGEVTGEYLWSLVPVFSGGPGPGNAIVMEAFPSGPDATEDQEGTETPSERGVSRATYVFRMMPASEYGAATLDERRAGAEKMLATINEAMIEVNFRREPVYLTEARLREPAHVRYLHSLRRLPALRTLRDAYAGRVAHTAPEAWETGLRDLLGDTAET